jgi:hypothetical protein
VHRVIPCVEVARTTISLAQAQVHLNPAWRWRAKRKTGVARAQHRTPAWPPHLAAIERDRNRAHGHVDLGHELAAARARRHVPHADVAVLVARYELVLARVERDGGDGAAGLELALAAASAHVPNLDGLVLGACARDCGCGEWPHPDQRVQQPCL